MAALLLPTPAARAAHWIVSVTAQDLSKSPPLGGYWGAPSPMPDGTTVSQRGGGGASANAPTSVDIKIILHVAGAWTADATDPYPIPAPTSVVLQETSAAACSGHNDGGQSFTGSVDDGVGDTGDSSVASPAGGKISVAQTPGGVFSFDRTLTASVTAQPNPPTYPAPPDYQYKVGMSYAGAGVGPTRSTSPTSPSG